MSEALKNGEKVLIKQTRSSARRTKDQRETLRCLGLAKIGREAEHEVSPMILGMLKRVAHLIEIRRV